MLITVKTAPLQALQKELRFLSDVLFFEFIFRAKGSSFQTKCDAAVDRLVQRGVITRGMLMLVMRLE